MPGQYEIGVSVRTGFARSNWSLIEAEEEQRRISNLQATPEQTNSKDGKHAHVTFRPTERKVLGKNFFIWKFFRKNLPTKRREPYNSHSGRQGRLNVSAGLHVWKKD